MFANGKLHKFYWRSYKTVNGKKHDMYDLNGNKFKLLIVQVGQKEYQLYFPYSSKTPVIDFYLKKQVTIEYGDNLSYRKNLLSIDDGLQKLTFTNYERNKI